MLKIMKRTIFLFILFSCLTIPAKAQYANPYAVPYPYTYAYGYPYYGYNYYPYQQGKQKHSVLSLLTNFLYSQSYAQGQGQQGLSTAPIIPALNSSQAYVSNYAVPSSTNQTDTESNSGTEQENNDSENSGNNSLDF